MMTGSKPLIASVLLLCGVCFPQKSSADGFTGHDFLEWDHENQHGLVDLSVTMIGILAAQTQKDIGRCIDDWYSDDDAIQLQRGGYILDTIEKYPTYHPQAIVLAVVEKQCGKFERENG